MPRSGKVSRRAPRHAPQVPVKLGVRSSGVLLHPTSLPGPHGIGDLGPQAHESAETLAACGQSWWQMLPVAPPGAGHSPYSAFSAFAGNPMLLSLDSMKEQGCLRDESGDAPDFQPDRVDFAAAKRFKWPRFLKAFDWFETRAKASVRRGFDAFCRSNAAWLDDYALFEALRETHPNGAWTRWPPELRRREHGALESARRDLARSVRFQKFLQYEFFRQWRDLRRHCAKLGVGLIGDVPIFAALDSADVWARQELFWLDSEGRPLKVAGVPPDYFSRTGQLWGNPLYRWDALRERGYDWWIDRFKATFERFDAVRLDHFIGFHNYWEIPAGSPTAETGRWAPGPGAELFEQARKALGPLQLIAEDLGLLTQEVKDLRERLKLPGMRVLQFEFGNDSQAENGKAPDLPRHCVVYTGTHDNDTTAGWFHDGGGPKSTRSKEQIERERANALRCLGTDGREIHWDMIRLAFSSAADTAIVPMQDLLGLGSEARMNTPGTAEGNWRWRMRDGAFSEEIARRLSDLTRANGRRRSDK